MRKVALALDSDILLRQIKDYGVGILTSRLRCAKRLDLWRGTYRFSNSPFVKTLDNPTEDRQWDSWFKAVNGLETPHLASLLLLDWFLLKVDVGKDR
jgi:hypothetical protein